MKLQDDIVEYIFNVVKTADIVHVDHIIIEPGMVRSMNEARTVGLFNNKDVPDMPFVSIGITRIHDLLTRFSIAKDQTNFTMDVSSNDEHATQFMLKAKGLKIDYRCGDPRKLTAPKTLLDVECFRVQITEEAVSFFQKGIAAMSADEVTLLSKDGVSFEFRDDSHDIYSYTLSDNVELVPNDEGKVSSSTKFAHRYPAKTLLALFKQNPEASFTVGLKGMLRFPLNGLTVFVMPRV